MNNKTRVITIAIILAFILTSLFLIVPITTKFIIGYIFALLSLTCLALGALILMDRQAKLPQDYAIPIVARNYLILNLLVSVIVISLEALKIYKLPYLYFLIAHIALLGFFIIRVITLFAGKEHIENVDTKVSNKTFVISMMLADIDSIKEQSSSMMSPSKEKALVEITKVYDAIRYSDPMSSDQLFNLDNQIKSEIGSLETAVANQDLGLIEQSVIMILRQIKDRNNRVKALK